MKKRTHDPVPQTTNMFYAPHGGDGGSAIYRADFNRLTSWERELNELCVRNHSVMLIADTEDDVTDAYAACWREIASCLGPVVNVFLAKYVQNGPLTPVDVRAAFDRAVDELVD